MEESLLDISLVWDSFNYPHGELPYGAGRCRSSVAAVDWPVSARDGRRGDGLVVPSCATPVPDIPGIDGSRLPKVAVHSEIIWSALTTRWRRPGIRRDLVSMDLI